ncbi:MAG: metal-dependent hydrolase [Gammaproteobacteria bacterium]|nr:metal-dependent hydrolase [Gammaproteobacteria bacterium]
MQESQISHTPDTVTILPRDVIFDVHGLLSENWCGDDAFRTDFCNALSLSFPRGEKFFVDSVRHFLPQITDSKLHKEALEFVQQEFMHRREHERYNQDLCKARGFNKDDIESIYAARIRQSNALPPLIRLSITVCLEHFTALFANGVMTDARWLEGVDPKMQQLWLWHAVEETEHKAVAYDVFLAVGGKRKMLRTTMRYVLYRFFMNTFRTMRKMQKAEGRSLAPRTYWYRGIRYLFGRGGILRVQKKEYLRFFAEDFHPWEFDNSYLIDTTLQRLSLPV